MKKFTIISNGKEMSVPFDLDAKVWLKMYGAKLPPKAKQQFTKFYDTALSGSCCSFAYGPLNTMLVIHE